MLNIPQIRLTLVHIAFMITEVTKLNNVELCTDASLKPESLPAL